MRWFAGFIFLILEFFLIPICAFSNVATQIPDAKIQSQTNTNWLTSGFSHYQFTHSQIQKNSLPQLSSFLKGAQSGLRITKNSGDSSQAVLSLRGFGDNASANSLILIDGFPLTHPSLLAPNLDRIALPLIDRIEVIEGSQGSLYGNQAVGGILNIKTMNPLHRSFFLTTRVGSQSQVYQSIFLADRSSNGWFYQVFTDTDKNHHSRDHQLQKENQIGIRLGKEYAKGFTRLSIQSDNRLIYFPGVLTESQWRDNPNQATEWNNQVRYQTRNIQLFNKQELNSRWFLETRFSQDAMEGNGLIYLKFKRHDKNVFWSPRLLGYFQEHQIILGYDEQLSDYDFGNARTYSQVQSHQQDLYGQIKFHLSKLIDFTAGTRLALQQNRVELLDNPIFYPSNRIRVYELGLNVHPTQTLSFFIRRDGNFRFPKANEQTWLSPDIKRLKAQSGVSYEAGVNWRYHNVDSQFSIYQLNLENETAFNPQENQNQPLGSYSNLDPTRRLGAGLIERYQVNPRLSMSAQAHYVDARMVSGRFSGKAVPAVPNWYGDLGFQFNCFEHWITQYHLFYTGSRYASEDMDNIGEKISSTLMHNIDILYQIKYFQAGFEIHNIFNKREVGYAYYNPSTRQNMYYPNDGRAYALTLKINLN